MVARVASRRSTDSSVPIQPKSRAAAVDRSKSPILVGDVRWAMTGLGSSWKLSGGSMLSDAVTKVSKKRQVRRAISLSDVASAPEIASVPASTGGTLTHRAIAGEISQARMKGAVIGIAPRPAYQTNTAANEVMRRLP